MQLSSQTFIVKCNRKFLTFLKWLFSVFLIFVCGSDMDICGSVSVCLCLTMQIEEVFHPPYQIRIPFAQIGIVFLLQIGDLSIFDGALSYSALYQISVILRRGYGPHPSLSPSFLRSSCEREASTEIPLYANSERIDANSQQ